MKFTHKNLILAIILTTIGVHVTIAQNSAWNVLNDCGLLINARGADCDEEGGFYVTGEYKGEVLFKSANEQDTTYRNYISEHLKKSFLVKYDSLGHIQFVLEVINQSISSTYSVTVKALSSGEIAWIIRVDGNYSIIDTRGKKHSFRANGQSVLILLNKAGEIISQTDVPFDYCREIIEMPNASLLLFGTSNRTRKNVLFKMDKQSMRLEQLFAGTDDLHAVNVKQDSIFVLTLDVERARYKPLNIDLAMYYLDNKDMVLTPNLMFRKRMVGHGFGLMNLFSTVDEVNVVLTIKHTPGVPYTIDGLEKTPTKEGWRLMKLNRKGNLVDELWMHSKVIGQYNTSIVQAKDGGYYIQTPAMDTLEIEGKPGLIFLPQHSDFIHELTLIKLNKDFDYEWHSLLGGTASNYHQSFTVPHKNTIYFATDILDYITIDGVTTNLNWRAGLLVGKLNETQTTD